MSEPRVELLLVRHADTAWREVIRPWFEREWGRLQRSYVVVPTRGQAQGLKQRCLVEELALLGVEFLSPGLARKKWVAIGAGGAGAKPAMGRELLLLGLRAILARRLGVLAPGAAERGVLLSLQSDPGGALDDFDDLLRGGFGAEDFPLEALRGVFGELVVWVGEMGFDFAPRQSEKAALTPVGAEEARIGGRLLVCGLGVEMWGEFFNVAAFARRFDDLTVVLPVPEFRGRKLLDEAWVELWEKLMGVSGSPVADEEGIETCESVAALWTGSAAAGGEFEAGRTKVIVGRTRMEEMERVADEIGALLDRGAENIAVIFPRSDAAHLCLARLLTERGEQFVDLLEAAGPPPVETRAQRAIIAFHEGGGRLEEFLELWSLLRALGRVEQPLAVARDVCERLFDERQTHTLATYQERLDASERVEWREVARIAKLLLPVWPEEATLAETLGRFAEVSGRFELGVPAGWGQLEAFAARETRPLPARVLLAALGSFLPEKGPVKNMPGKGIFARVTLTTRRRAEGLAWTHAIFVESNAGVWPERSEPSAWLADEWRSGLNERGRFSLGLFTGEDRAWMEKRGCGALVRDTRAQVIFSAALFDEQEPELKLGPNSWLERVLWATRGGGDAKTGLEELFEQCVQPVAGRRRPCPVEREAGAPAEAVQGEGGLDAWLAVWRGRRDPAKAFDGYFLSVDPKRIRPEKLPARLIERSVRDPAELWFEVVLGARRVGWEPFMRARKKALGQLAHRVLATTLRGPLVEGRFAEMPKPEVARARLARELAVWRGLWPEDRYWDSFHAELGGICVNLLEKVLSLDAGRFVAVELSLPAGATVPLGAGGGRLEVHGRMDLVRLDRPEWSGAMVDIVDFKTGADARLSAAKMARDGGALQLGVYLAAAQSLGAAGGRVWMLKPEERRALSMEMAELPEALAKLEQLGRHLDTGVYGALSPDRSEYSPSGYRWPLACAPIEAAVMRKKFAVTFGVEQAVEQEVGDE